MSFNTLYGGIDRSYVYLIMSKVVRCPQLAYILVRKNTLIKFSFHYEELKANLQIIPDSA